MRQRKLREMPTGSAFSDWPVKPEVLAYWEEFIIESIKEDCPDTTWAIAVNIDITVSTVEPPIPEAILAAGTMANLKARLTRRTTQAEENIDGS